MDERTPTSKTVRSCPRLNSRSGTLAPSARGLRCWCHLTTAGRSTPVAGDADRDDGARVGVNPVRAARGWQGDVDAPAEAWRGHDEDVDEPVLRLPPRGSRRRVQAAGSVDTQRRDRRLGGPARRGRVGALRRPAGVRASGRRRRRCISDILTIKFRHTKYIGIFSDTKGVHSDTQSTAA